MRVSVSPPVLGGDEKYQTYLSEATFGSVCTSFQPAGPTSTSDEVCWSRLKLATVAIFMSCAKQTRRPFSAESPEGISV